MAHGRNRRTRKSRKFLIGAAILAAVIAGTADYSDPLATVGIPADSISEQFREDLIQAGYHGRPDDDSETIYAPRSVAHSMCITESDCEATD